MLRPVEARVEPAHCWVPPFETSAAGAEAADLAASAGLVLDPEQRLMLEVMLAERADGKWAAIEAAIICPRRNGKTWAIIAAALADLFLFGAKTVVWSAHEFKTAMEAYRDIKALIEGADHLRRRVSKFRETNGDEGFDLFDGGRMLFKARTKTGGRGLGGDRVVLDEAFALKPSMVGSLMPLVATYPNPQIVYASSAGLVDSDVLRRIRDRGRAGGDPALAYVEWCAPVVDCESPRCDHVPPVRGCALDNDVALRAANPSYPRRISSDYMRAERLGMPPSEFVRERLGWWDEPVSALAGVPLELWEPAAVRSSSGDLSAVAVDVTPDFSWSSVAVARECEGGHTLEVVEHRRGTDWVADAVTDLGCPIVVVDLGGPASVVAPDLLAVDVAPTTVSSRDVAQACAGLLDALVRGSVWHVANDALDAAVKGAVRAPLGDAFKWSRKSSAVDISPLVSVTLALWGARHCEDGGKPVFAY